MRLEKIVYEKVLNNKLLGRARQFGKPRLSHVETNHLLAQYPNFGLYSLLGWLLRPMFRFNWKFLNENCHDRGLALEDVQLFRSEELRRNPLTEHAFRESLHPFMREMFRYRAHRYYKIDHAVKGFIVPDYLKDEARKRTMLQTFGNIITFRHFFKQNYENEQTPTTTMFRTSLNILEFALIYGITNRNGWNRYFWNEVEYYTIGDYVKEIQSSKPLNLEDPAQLEKFLANAEKMNEQYPGIFAPYGEKVNREQVKRDLKEIVAQTHWTNLTDEDLTDFGMRHRMSKEAFVHSKVEGEEAKGKSNVGLDKPTFLRKGNAKGFFN